MLMKLQATRVVVLGVAMDEERRLVLGPFVQKARFALGRVMRPLNYPVLIGTAAADAYGVEGLPMTVVVDGRGRQVRGIDAAIEFDDVDRSVRALLAAT